MQMYAPSTRIRFTELPDHATRLVARQWIPRPQEEVFQFFARPRNLGILTPPWVDFRKLEESAPTPGRGARVGFDMRIRGFPIHWVAEFTRWEPPHLFTDRQQRGPYRQWEHTHRFESAGCGTRVIDEVVYRAPGSRWMDRWLVRPELRKLFVYRQRALTEVFGGATMNLATFPALAKRMDGVMISS